MARIVHCWHGGPETEDGCSTTCMLLDGHEGEHEWSRDDQIGIRFADGFGVQADVAKKDYDKFKP